MSADFGNLDLRAKAEQGIRVHPVGPEDERSKLYTEHGTPVIFIMAGRDSKLHADAKKAIASQLDEDNVRLDLDTIQEHTIKLAAETCIGWENVYMNGELLEFNRQTAREFINNPGYRWLAEQLVAAQNDRSKLFLESSGN